MKNISIFFAAFLLFFCFSSCSFNPCSKEENPFDYLKEEEVFIESIYLNSILAKNSYARGESLDFSKLIVRGCFSNGCEKTISITEKNISGYDCMKCGEQKLKIAVDYNGKTVTAEWIVNVTSAVPVELVIKSLPEKMEYTDSEKFNPSGLNVVMLNSDKTETPVNDSELVFTFDSSDSSAKGTKTVFIHYRGFSKSFEIKIL